MRGPMQDLGAEPNARPRRGAPLSSYLMTSSCSVNRVTIVVEHRHTVQQGCQFGFFEAKFVIFGLFSTLLAFFIFEKTSNEIWRFWPFLANKIFMSIWQI